MCKSKSVYDVTGPGDTVVASIANISFNSIWDLLKL